MIPFGMDFGVAIHSHTPSGMECLKAKKMENVTQQDEYKWKNT